MYITMSVPRSALSQSSMVKAGLPSHDHFTALLPSCQLFVMISTFLLTMKAE